MKHHKNQLLLQFHRYKTRAPLAALNMRKLNSDNGLNNLRHEEEYPDVAELPEEVKALKGITADDNPVVVLMK